MSTQMKKSMTAVDLKALVEEIKNIVVGERVQNIYYLSTQGILLFKMKIGDYRYLVMEPGKRVHLTKFSIDVPESPGLLAMSFRKHLRDQQVDDIAQIGFDRILKVTFRNGASIYIEILPRGEIVLTDEHNNILHSTGFKKMKDREIRRGIQYVLPPHVERLPSIEECISLLEKKEIQGISRVLGIPPEVLNEALKRGSGVPQIVCQEIEKILEDSGKLGGFIVFRNELPISFHPYNPTAIEKEDKVKFFDKFNDAVDEFFYKILSLSSLKTISDEERRLSLKVQEIASEIEKYEKEASELYLSAQKILENLQKLRELQKCVMDAREEFGWEKVKERCFGIEEIHPKEGTFTANLGEMKVDLPVNLDPYSFIQRMFEEARKLKRKAESGKQHLEELKRKLEEQREMRVERTEEFAFASRKKSWYEKFRWSITRNGFLVIAGRDMQQNTTIVRKYLKEADIYLHADIQGAPSTVLITDGKSVAEEDIFDAAVIAAAYSKAWKENLTSIDVFWVKGNQVSLSPPSGEYLRKGSFMIYGQKNYIKNVYLMLYIGVQRTEDGYMRPIVGSESSVKINGIPIAALVPGDLSPDTVLEKLISIGKRLNLNLLPLREDLRLLIPGKAKIRASFGNQDLTIK
ncbi:MAG: ribosome rescue protein RqcH [Fervidicoccaceae archaeon]